MSWQLFTWQIIDSVFLYFVCFNGLSSFLFNKNERLKATFQVSCSWDTTAPFHFLFVCSLVSRVYLTIFLQQACGGRISKQLHCYHSQSARDNTGTRDSFVRRYSIFYYSKRRFEAIFCWSAAKIIWTIFHRNEQLTTHKPYIPTVQTSFKRLWADRWILPECPFFF
jgi:hypothetical protein